MITELSTLILLLCSFKVSQQRRNSKEDDIRRDLAGHLGFSSVPDRNINLANVSQEEFNRKLRIYMKSVSQTRRAHAFKQRIHQEDFLQRSLEIQPQPNVWSRQRRSVDKDNSDYIFFNRSSIPGRSYISKATLRVHLIEAPLDESCQVSVTQMLDGEDGVALDSSSSYEDFIDLDVTHAVQAWSLNPKKTKQKILRLQQSGCAGVAESSLHVQYFTSSLLRVKRSQGSPRRLNHRHQRRRRKHLCRRKVMGVDLDDLGGFDFIVMPRYFNAAMCSGKCPARYKPQGDHSLLQSLVSLRSRDHVSDHVATPCCSPAHYEGLDVLHLDDRDHSKLKVTHWKDVKVSKCACA